MISDSEDDYDYLSSPQKKSQSLMKLLSKANQAWVRGKNAMPFLCRWMNYILGFKKDSGKKPLNVENICYALRDGAHIIGLLRVLVPDVDFGFGLYAKCNS